MARGTGGENLELRGRPCVRRAGQTQTLELHLSRLLHLHGHGRGPTGGEVLRSRWISICAEADLRARPGRGRAPGSEARVPRRPAALFAPLLALGAGTGYRRGHRRETDDDCEQQESATELHPGETTPRHLGGSGFSGHS